MTWLETMENVDILAKLYLDVLMALVGTGRRNLRIRPFTVANNLDAHRRFGTSVIKLKPAIGLCRPELDAHCFYKSSQTEEWTFGRE